MFRSIFLFISFLIPQFLLAQIDPVRNAIRNIQPDRPMDIYLVIGQSNMAGRAQIREEDQAPIGDAFLFTGEEETPWAAAANPLNLYSTVRKKVEMQRLGPAYAFAKSMVEDRAVATRNKALPGSNQPGPQSISVWHIERCDLAPGRR